MKFYNSVGPNPRMVRMFMAEKGFDVPKVEVDLRGGENRREPYLKVNPSGQCPALELDDGTVLAEITAICEYVDEVKKDTPSLIGDTPEERANDAHVGAPHRPQHRRAGAQRLPLLAGAEDLPGPRPLHSRGGRRPEGHRAQKKLVWLDGLMGSKPFIAGDKLTMADILLFAFLDFMGKVGQPLDPANKNLTAWIERMKARPSAAA